MVSRDLLGLLDGPDPGAPLAQRHVWLIDLIAWIRGNEQSVDASLARLRLLLDAAAGREDFRQRLQAWWRQLVDTVDATTLLADYGFAPRTAFLSELGERLRHRLLPSTPETTDAAELFALVFSNRFDGQWLAAMDEDTVNRLTALVSPDAQRTRWDDVLVDAITYCIGQIGAAGFAPEIRSRIGDAFRTSRPFHRVGDCWTTLREALAAHGPQAPQTELAAQALRQQMDACRHAASSVYGHLDDNGISVGLVFRLRQLRERLIRVRELLDALLSPRPAVHAARLLARLVAVGEERRSIRALISSNSSLLAAKVVQRSAETGEHYITRNRAQYRQMLLAASGGGALMSITTLMKFAIVGLGLSAFWGGFFAGVNYAMSFVLIQLLHFTVATKQPAMTAPAMAAKLRDLGSPQAVESFVDEVTHLVRSQVAAVIGNLALVVPCVIVLTLLLGPGLGHPPLTARDVEHVWHALTVLGPTVLFAGFTGVLLFASSIIAGWAENWFVLHRLDSAMRYHPRLNAVLGPQRAQRWAQWLRQHVSGLAANVSLGFMLGLVPAFASFFGLGLDVRHVTLSTGQITAAAVSEGWTVLGDSRFWWCVAAIPLTAMLNVGVSFWCAFRLALRAHSVGDVDRQRIRQAVRARWVSQPLSFFLPAREPAAPSPLV